MGDLQNIERRIRACASDHAEMRRALAAGGAFNDMTPDAIRRHIDEVLVELEQLSLERTREYVKPAALAPPSASASAPTPPSECACQRGQFSRCVVDEHTATVVCTECGRSRSYCDSTEAFTNFGDLPFRRRSSGYHPPNHFSEIVAQFQGKRRTQAPAEVVQLVRRDCDRYHIPPACRTAHVVRRFLKQRRHSDCYRFCAEMSAQISGMPAPYMTPMQEERVAMLFPLTVEAYRSSPRYERRKRNRNNRAKVEPNNMNYFYVFYKLCQMLGYAEFLPYIPLPKSAANIDDNDNNGWRHVCEFNGWRYTPTR